MNRRQLLELFGVGAVAVPVVAGVPELEAPVRLVEPAKFEPVKLQHTAMPPLFRANLAGSRCMITVEIVTDGGENMRFMADSFVVDHHIELLEPREIFSRYIRPIPGRREVRWELRGICIDPEIPHIR